MLAIQQVTLLSSWKIGFDILQQLKAFFVNLNIDIKLLREKCEKLEKEKAELTAKMQAGDFVDLDTLHQVKQEKHKLQKEVKIPLLFLLA